MHFVVHLFLTYWGRFEKKLWKFEAEGQDFVTYNVQQFLPYNVQYLGAFLEPPLTTLKSAKRPVQL